MSDTNLDPSISALSTRATEVAASASPRELLNLSRIAPSLEQSENAGLEVAINSRAAGLAPSATATELKSIGKAIGNVLEPDTFTAGAFIPAQLDQSGKFLGTSGTSKNWSGVTVSGLSEVNISAIANDETLVYNHVSSQFENSSQVFNIPQYAQTADLPASATSGATAFDASTAELKYWNGSEWKVAAVVATGGGASIKSVEFLPPGYIVVADSDDLTLTGAFTIETWLKAAGSVQAASKTYSTIASKWAHPNAPEYWFGFVASGGQQSMRFAWADQTSQGGSTSPLLSYLSSDFAGGDWVHVAIVRTTDGTFTMYVNGVSVDSVSRSFTPPAASTSEPLYIGTYNAGQVVWSVSWGWEGLISDFRIVNGDAVYTTNFTPPAQPLQKIANTVLLTARGLESATVIADESDSNHTIETNYAVEISDEMPYTISSGSSSSAPVDWSPLTLIQTAGKSVYNLTGTAPELLTNPSFESTTGWNDVNSGWTVGSGSAIMANTGSWKPLVAGPLGLTIGETYKAEIVISAITGSIKFDLGTSNGSYIRGNTTQGLGITVTETGTHSFTFTYNGYTTENTAFVDYIGFGRADVSGSSATVDSVSLKLANSGGTTGESDLAVDMTETHTVLGVDKAYSGYGAAYIIDTVSGNVTATINNPNPITAGSFARRNSVGTDGTHVVLGNRDQDEVYVYNMSGTLLRTISGPDSGAMFGHSVKIDGDYIVVGGYNQDKAYICSTSTGAILHTLTNPNVYGSTPDQFGQVVDISGNFMVVSTVEEDAADGSNSGVAYVYTVDAGSLLHTFVNPNAHGTSALDNFGIDCALDGNYLVVGAFGESDAAVGSGSGKAYFYNVATGTLLHTIDNPNPDSGTEVDYMGWSVDVEGQTAIVSAWYETGAAGADSGKCYLYDVVSGNLLHTIEDPDLYSASGTDDRFGSEVAIAGNYFAVSAKGEDHASQDNVGALYVFRGE